jgi:small-conductance mechanosensitive channel
MSPCNDRGTSHGRLARLLTALLLLLMGAGPLHAQPVPAGNELAAADSEREIAVAPAARDAAIAGRLTRILKASGWFVSLDISVREGIVFLDGQTETDERKKWAEALALRTEDVVAVVNRLEVDRPINWNLTPAWREVQGLVDQARWLAPMMLVSLLILAVFVLASRGVASFTRSALRQRMTSPLLADVVARAVALPVILIGVYLVLQLAGLTRLAVTVLGGTGLLGIVLGLAFREIAENSLASILLSARNPFSTGDWIEIGEYQGIVQNLNMRTTILLTLDGNHVQIPNSTVFKSVITNFSSNPNRRAEFAVGIGYDDSIARAQDVIVSALRAHPAVLDDPEPAAIVDELGPSTVNIRVQFWFDGRAYSVFRVRSALLRQVKRALQDAGISMPDAAREIIFPQGVPLRRADGGAVGREDGAVQTALDAADSAAASSGEGDLRSEKQDLQRQAERSNLPEAGENLLAGGAPRKPTGKDPDPPRDGG